jgi:glycosyltransferase involved in cell wall biosynthesis
VKVAIHVDGPTIRGNERQVIRIAAGLRARGHDVVVSCRAGGPVEAELRSRGIRTTGVRPGGDADLWNALRFVAWLRRERPDATLMTSWKRAFIGAWCARAAGLPRVVFRLGSLQSIRPGPRGWLERDALRRYDAIIAISRGVAERIVETAPEVDPARVHTVLNGIEVKPAPPAPIRAQLGLPADAILCGAVGGMERSKGFYLLVEALASVAASVHAVLVGGGTDEQRRALEEQARALGVAERVHLLGRRGDVPAVLAACDLFALTSRWEGMGVALLEAMAVGCPAVAADVGGTWDAVAARDGRPPAGWVVPAREAAGIAAGVREVVDALRNDPAEVAARVAEARWRIAHWFAVDRMVDEYEAVLAGKS